MHDIGVIFLTHEGAPEDVETQNLESVKKWADCPLVVLRGAAAKNPAERQWFWRNSDLPIYAWHSNPHEVCARWFVCEWDTYLAMPLREFLAPTWDMDFVAPATMFPSRDRRWCWFKEVNKLPSHWAPAACGALQACTMFSNRALTAATNNVRNDKLDQVDVFCELRMATACALAGFKPAANPLADDRITCETVFPNGPGVWHAVKAVIPSKPR